jgi:nitrogen regulatory protein PII
MSQTAPPYRLLTVVVKPFRAAEVLRVLEITLGPAAMADCVVREAKGHGRQKGYLDRYLGSEYSMAFLPKVEISIPVAPEQYENAQQAVVKAARTGRIGDGKIFLIPSVVTLDI